MAAFVYAGLIRVVINIPVVYIRKHLGHLTGLIDISEH
jgi:hypothetical protein